MQLKNIRMRDAGHAIEDRLDFGVRASKYVREYLDIKHSLRGYRPLEVVGYYGTAGLREQLPAEYFLKMSDQMERRHVAYIVESYNTVIAWVDSSGEVHMPPFRHSLTTTQHQHTAAYALTGQSFYRAAPDAERSELSQTGTIGRQGW